MLDDFKIDSPIKKLKIPTSLYLSISVFDLIPLSATTINSFGIFLIKFKVLLIFTDKFFKFLLLIPMIG